jgi:hypothetical protein
MEEFGASGIESWLISLCSGCDNFLVTEYGSIPITYASLKESSVY